MNSDTVFNIPRNCYHFISVNVYENISIFIKHDFIQHGFEMYDHRLMGLERYDNTRSLTHLL
jgi:hypothetical protein